MDATKLAELRKMMSEPDGNLTVLLYSYPKVVTDLLEEIDRLNRDTVPIRYNSELGQNEVLLTTPTHSRWAKII